MLSIEEGNTGTTRAKKYTTITKTSSFILNATEMTNNNIKTLCLK